MQSCHLARVGQSRFGCLQHTLEIVDHYLAMHCSLHVLFVAVFSSVMQSDRMRLSFRAMSL